MSLKYIAVKDCELSADTGTGTLEIETAESSNSKIDNKGIYAGELKIKISDLKGTGFNQGIGSGKLTGSAKKFLIDDKTAVLEGDESETITVTAYIDPLPPSPPYTTTIPTVVKIKSAGQEKVQGE